MLYAVFVAGAILGAVALDLWLLHWLRQRMRPDPTAPTVYVLRTYSPILTWLKYRRLPNPTRPTPSAASHPQLALHPTSEGAAIASASASGGHRPAAPAVDGELDFRIVLVVTLSSAVGLTALGQQVYSRAPETQMTGIGLLASGVVLFTLARHFYRARALPHWLSAVSARLHIAPFQIILLLLAIGSAYLTRVFAGNDALMLYPAAAVVSWLAALGLVMAGSYAFGARRDVDAEGLGPSWSRREIAALAVLVLLAFLVRVVANGEIPRALTGDEGSLGLAAVEIVEGRFNNPFIVSWYSFPALFFFVPALSIKLGGHTYEALRLPSAIAGALTVASLYWLARPMFGRGVAAVSAAMLAALNFHVHFSRIGLNNIWDGLFAVLALGMVWRGWRSRRRSYFIGAGLVVGVGNYFYTSATVVPLIMLAWLTLAVAVNWRGTRPRLLDVFFLVIVAAVTVMPLVLFYLKFPDQFFAPMRRVSILEGNWLAYASGATGEPAWRLVLNNYWQAAQGFTNVPLQAWYASGKPMLLALPAGLFILGVTLALFNLRDERYWLLMLWLAGVISIGALTESSPAGQRYIIGAPAAVLMAAIPLVTMAHWIAELWPRVRPATSMAVGAVVILTMAFDLSFYFREYAPNFSGRVIPIRRWRPSWVSIFGCIRRAHTCSFLARRGWVTMDSRRFPFWRHRCRAKTWWRPSRLRPIGPGWPARGFCDPAGKAFRTGVRPAALSRRCRAVVLCQRRLAALPDL